MPSQTFSRPSAKTSSFFQTNFAPFAFFHAHEQGDVQPQRFKHFARGANLPFAAVYEYDVWHARGLRGGAAHFVQGVSDFCVAARERLPHSGVVVAAGDALYVVAAVLAGLHLVRLKYDATRLRCLACGMADVKTFNAQGIQRLQRQFQRLRQRCGARVLRALLREQARELQRGALPRHVQPNAALPARGVRGVDAAAFLVA